MAKSFRRFEILLPLRFNDGQPVPNDLIADTLLELEQRFGAVSCETQTIQGRWQHMGQQFRDDLVRVFVDVPDVPENKQFFIEFKERAKARFQQLDIWMTTRPGRLLALVHEPAVEVGPQALGVLDVVHRTGEEVSVHDDCTPAMTF